jgi:hypothetical protein
LSASISNVGSLSVESHTVCQQHFFRAHPWMVGEPAACHAGTGRANKISQLVNVYSQCLSRVRVGMEGASGLSLVAPYGCSLDTDYLHLG